MCPEQDSNLHANTRTTPSRWRVYQFHHLGIVQTKVANVLPLSVTKKTTLGRWFSLSDPSGARTLDPYIKSVLLYQLS